MKDDFASVEITRSKLGLPCAGVGGGSFADSFMVRYVLSPSNELKRAIFIRRRGDLACRLDQAIVPLTVGDKIVTLRGKGPIVQDNPNLQVKIHVVTSDNTIHEASVDWSIPRSVSKGGGVFHNRDGTFFARLPKKNPAVTG